MPGRFPPAEIIVANIDAPTLLANVGALKAKLKRGGVLITSGITARSRLELVASFARAGLLFASEHRKGEWFAYVHEKP